MATNLGENRAWTDTYDEVTLLTEKTQALISVLTADADTGMATNGQYDTVLSIALDHLDSLQEKHNELYERIRLSISQQNHN